MNKASAFLTALLFFAVLTLSGQNAKQVYAPHSVLATGEWVQLAVQETGLQRITYADLQAMSFQMPIESDRLRVFGNGGTMLPEMPQLPREDDLRQVSCWISDGGDGLIDQPGDQLVFYAEGPVVWRYDTVASRFVHQIHYYSRHTCYFLNVSDTPGIPVASTSSLPDVPDSVITCFQDHQVHELDSISLIHSGKLWYGEVFNLITSRQFGFDLPNLKDQAMAEVRFSLASRSLDTSYYQISAGDTSVRVMFTPVDPNVNTDYVRIANASFMTKQTGGQSMDVQLDYDQPNESSTGWLNYLAVTAVRELIFTGGQMAFRSTGSIGQGVVEYRIADFHSGGRVWDVTDPSKILEISVVQVGVDAYFRTPGDSLREFIAFDGSAYHQPTFITRLQNQDLHGTGAHDLIIFTHPDFRQQAERLGAFRSSEDGLDVLVVEPQAVYNEFSSGMQDPTALRDFLRMLYLRAAGDSSLMPRYVLLFGDGSYDPLDRVEGNTNFIPTYQTNNSHTPTASYVSDDFYSLLDDGEGPNAIGLPDAGIGRLPAKTPLEAQTMVDKILRYSSSTDLLPPESHPAPGQISNFGDWRSVVCFIADDEDGNLHLNQAEILANMADSMNSNLNYDKIYLDAYQQEKTILGPRFPGVKEALARRVADGALLINYTGHGGETGLAEEVILDISDIDAWDNYFNMPVFITATCEFSRYDDPEEVSAGEHVLLNRNGGGVALLSTTRVAYAHSNMIINTNVLSVALVPGNHYSLGDIMRLGKEKCGTSVYMQNFTLLGDPSMKLAFPEEKVILTSLNGDSLSPGGDTLRAGEQIILGGAVCDAYGTVISNFDGELTLTVYDKPANVQTLSNDPQSYVTEFSCQHDLLFKGTATVTDGQFTIRFTLPKDVSFREGNARISMYARSLNLDASGMVDDFCLLNDGNCGPGDGQGPDIALYLNDRGFVEQGYTGSDATLIADLQDDDGINFFSAGIGHDITLVLDDDFVNPIVMNGHYLPTCDDAGKGTVLYELTGLSDGPHKLWLRAWDVLNYASEKEIGFLVRTRHDLSLNHLSVYPNPTRDGAWFCFDRNQTDLLQWTQISIKTLDGRILKTIEQEAWPSSGISLCVEWDGSGESGAPLPAGLYLFSLRLIDEMGNSTIYTGKIAKTE